MFSSRQAVSRHRVSREITNGADTLRKSNRKHRQQIVFHIWTLINTESSSNRKSDTEPEERENLAPEGKLGTWEPHQVESQQIILNYLHFASSRYIFIVCVAIFNCEKICQG